MLENLAQELFLAPPAKIHLVAYLWGAQLAKLIIKTDQIFKQS
jgi:hypothetical protein